MTVHYLPPARPEPACAEERPRDPRPREVERAPRPTGAPRRRFADDDLLAADAPDDNTSWLVTFSDLVILLFGFVVLSLTVTRAAPAASTKSVERATAAIATVAVEPRASVTAAAPRRERTRAAGGVDRARELHASDGGASNVEVVAENRSSAEVAAEDESTARIAPALGPSIASPRADDVDVAATGAGDADLSASRAHDARAAAPGSSQTDGAAALAAPSNVAAADAPQTERFAALARYLDAFSEATGLAHAVAVKGDDSGVELALGGDLGFASGRAELHDAALPLLREIGALVRDMPDVELEIDGHTDGTPVRSHAYPSNLELSLLRAARVAHAVAGDDAALAARIVTAGFADHRPLTSNARPSDRARNRRVELRIVQR